MGKCKTKAIQTDLGIFMHIHAYARIFRHFQAYPEIIRHILNPGIIQAYSGSCCNPGIFRILLHSESGHIQNGNHSQNPGTSKTLAHSEPEIYLESWAIQNPGIFRTRTSL